MLGKPEWFERRKYWGWGITPKTWQGWIYIFLIIVPLVIVQAAFNWPDKTRITITMVWLAVVLFDVFDIMIRLKKDEREASHEALAERNALWAMMTVLVIGMIYQIIRSAFLRTPAFIDPFIAGALIAATLVKTATNFYLDKRD